MVEGHTDTDQVRSTSIPRDNWELSVFSHGCGPHLVQDSVYPAVLAASGRSQYHPWTPTTKPKTAALR